MSLDPSRLDAWDAATARERLARCCGSTAWVEGMLARRPFGSSEALARAAEEVWFSLGEEDWLEAFSHHPRIGDVEKLRERFATTADLSEKEQAGVAAASEETLRELAEANDAYFEKNGFVFLICATGKSADAMLAALRERLGNDRGAELQNAAREQAKITRIRMEDL